ncbi:hypothetical protein DFQ27_008288 [Actinomortierella ambigua]|uniref:Mitochondrial resolvase Ydc2 catalytic domain-containing protein n=1 Tax=Actinomortierella ambigua TaxID=1343610 RepID=A0A9P6UBN5_9FUNG|nr:hypothetical protein DFQ27_008288 [Actinomortierella ambigua]
MPAVLQKRRLKELAKLAQDVGMQNSGSKALIADRLSAHFSRLLGRITAELGEPTARKWIKTPETHPQEKRDWFEPSRLRFLPASIVSIDVGLRNLAWVQLSRQGDVLRWDVEDLLTLDPGSDHGGFDATASDDVELSQCSKRKAANALCRTSKKKSPAVPYDSQSLAVAIDNLMYKILEKQSDTMPPIGAVVIERQHLRSTMIPGMVDGVVKSCVVEGMLLAWLKHWERHHNSHSQPGHREFVVDLVLPRAVGAWWGIGDSQQTGSAKIKSPRPGSDSAEDSDDIGEDNTITGRHARAIYSSKKARSTKLVKEWIIGSHVQHDAGDGVEEHTDRLRVKCPERLQAWYSAQSKQDDLSDCLLQAVAWYEWQARAITQSLWCYQQAT